VCATLSKHLCLASPGPENILSALDSSPCKQLHAINAIVWSQ